MNGKKCHSVGECYIFGKIFLSTMSRETVVSSKSKRPKSPDTVELQYIIYNIFSLYVCCEIVEIRVGDIILSKGVEFIDKIYIDRVKYIRLDRFFFKWKRFWIISISISFYTLYMVLSFIQGFVSNIWSVLDSLTFFKGNFHVTFKNGF